MRWWRISKMEQHTTCNTSSSTWPVLRLPSLYSNANSHSQVGSKGKFLFQVWQWLFLSPSKNMEISIHSCIMIKLLIKKKAHKTFERFNKLPQPPSSSPTSMWPLSTAWRAYQNQIDAETFSRFTAGSLTVNFIIGVLPAEQHYSVIWSPETNSLKCKQNTNQAKLWIVSWAAHSV